MKPYKTTEVWRADGTFVIRHFIGGAKTYAFRDREGNERELEEPPPRPRAPAIHGLFLGNKPRYLHTLAQRPNDPNAYVTSMHEADRKAHEVGGEIVRIEDVVDSHPAHATGTAYYDKV